MTILTVLSCKEQSLSPVSKKQLNYCISVYVRQIVIMQTADLKIFCWKLC